MKTNNHLIEAAGTDSDLIAITGEVKIEAAQADKTGPRRFEMLAYTGGTLSLPNFDLPVIVDLSTLSGGDKARPIFKDHDRKALVGHTDRITNDGKSLNATGIVSGSGYSAREVVEASDNGFPWQASIGAKPGKMDPIRAGRRVTVNSQVFEGPCIVARHAVLKEISFVALGADDNTSARIAAEEAAERGLMDFEKWLEAMGLALADISDQQQTKLRAKYDAEIAASEQQDEGDTATEDVEASEEADPVVDYRAKMANEAKRIARINEIAASHPKILAQAIEGGWDATKTELEVVKADRPQANVPNIHAHDKGLTSEMLEAAACQSAGMTSAELEKHFDEKTLEAADRRFHSRMGLQEMLYLAAAANGYSGGPFAIKNDTRGVLRAAFIEASAGFSTFSLSGIMGATANKFLLAGFTDVEDSWRQISAVRSVKDFRTYTSYRLSGGFEYDQLPPDGQIKHGSLGEESYTNQARTYAKMFAITRTDIINDDLDALTAIPRRLGRGAALKLNKVFWTAFLDNATFFTAANGTFFDGADSALSIASLTEGEGMFYDLTDPDGNPLAISPEILLVPNALSVTASTLMNGTEIRDTTASTQYTTTNPHAGKFRIVRSSYLSNSAITGNSATAWYLLANPNTLPVIEVAFLNGRQQPIVESADADFNTLGVQMRGYHDFGVAKQDYRGGVKSKGAA